MQKAISNYLSQIGRRGGLKSRRHLSREQAVEMVKAREAAKLFRKFHAQCFWSYDPNYKVKAADVPWIGKQLMKHGDRELWARGVKLCR